MDGVIVNSEPFHLATLRIIFRRYGIRYSLKEHATKYGGTGARHIIEGVLREHGVSADIDKLVAERTEMYQRLIRTRKLRTIAGFSRFLTYAKKLGVKVAIASGGHRTNIISSLRATKISPRLFGGIITVENVPQRKPHPQLFIAAARVLRAKPRECVVFEDTAAGVKATKRAHMRCVALLTTTTKKNLLKAGADLIVKDFRDKKLWQWLGRK
jgi:HAD superfamily hydrolase (TIGR01509 family)